MGVERHATTLRSEQEEMEVRSRAVPGIGRRHPWRPARMGWRTRKEVSMIRRIPRSILHGVLALALTAGAATALVKPAAADSDDYWRYHHEHHEHGGFYYYSGPRYYYAPPPSYYYAPPPPTYYYAPPYYGPGFSFGFRVH
jgi:hypothetical protein